MANSAQAGGVKFGDAKELSFSLDGAGGKPARAFDPYGAGGLQQLLLLSENEASWDCGIAPGLMISGFC